MLSPILLQALRDYWRGLKRKPTHWLFPGGCRHAAPHPITPKTVWYACQKAARHAGLEHRVHPHTLREGFVILHHLSESLHFKDNWPWSGTIGGSLRPEWTART